MSDRRQTRLAAAFWVVLAICTGQTGCHQHQLLNPPDNALPRELGACTTVYDRFRLWEQQGVFERIWQAGLEEYDELEGIAWEWQSMDGVMTNAPFGGAATGANPTDRGKRGTKRSKPE